MKIFLCDLSHTGAGIATESIPLNIGLIKSYLLKHLKKDIQITLFKYPEKLKEALDEGRLPDLIGFSNYTWNFNLDIYFSKYFKKLNQHGIVVFGGTNFPFEQKPQEKFMRAYIDIIDFHVYYEGEIAFLNLVKEFMKSGQKIKTLSIPGICQINPADGKFIPVIPVERIRSLDDIPSPYISGYLDEFFDGVLTPLVETARGCPFRCNFCNAGEVYFNKVNTFSNEYVRAELEYIANKSLSTGVRHITFADNNFGMIPKDYSTAEILNDLSHSKQWPGTITVWTGKNAKDRVIDVTRLLGNKLSISMSVQSMDEDVLRNVSRDKIKIEHYKAIADELNSQGRPQHAEIIMPLPGETLQSHISSLNSLLDVGVAKIFSHTLQMLHGTPYKDDPSYRNKFNYKTKWRVVPLNFTRFADKTVLDIEEVAIANNTFTFAEYVDARVYLFIIDIVYNSGIFNPIIRYLLEGGIKTSDWIGYIFKNRHKFDSGMKAIILSFINETKSELWDSESEIIEYFQDEDNYIKLLNYEIGGNVLFKHRVWTLSKNSLDFVSDIFTMTYDYLAEQDKINKFDLYLEDIQKFCEARIFGCFDLDEFNNSKFTTLRVDINRWLIENNSLKTLDDYLLDHPVEYEFFLTSEHKSTVLDGFNRYGQSLMGLVKLLQRTSGATFIRSCKNLNDSNIPFDPKIDPFLNIRPGAVST